MKIHSLGAELFYAKGETEVLTVGQTDMTKVIITFPTFANTPKTLSSSKRYIVSLVLQFFILFLMHVEYMLCFFF